MTVAPSGRTKREQGADMRLRCSDSRMVTAKVADDEAVEKAVIRASARFLP